MSRTSRLLPLLILAAAVAGIWIGTVVYARLTGG